MYGLRRCTYVVNATKEIQEIQQTVAQKFKDQFRVPV